MRLLAHPTSKSVSGTCWLWPCAVLLILLFSSAVLSAPMESDLPVEISIVTPPVPVRADSSLVLAYEVHVTDFRALELTLDQLSIINVADTTKPLAVYPKDSLTAMLWYPGVPPPDTDDARVLHGGQRIVIFVWLRLPLTERTPPALTHRLTFTLTNSKGDQVERAVEGGMTPVAEKPLTPYAWPVHEGEWLVANGPGANSDHRRAMHALDGRTFVAQRFAVDLMGFGSDGRLWHTNPFQNENWYGYGQEVLTAAAGEVISITDSVPENTPLAPTRVVPMTRANICGNCVVVKQSSGEYALYAHLKPGGIKVKPKDKVKQGDVLGYIGNSGNSDAPHLHFHVTDGPSPLAAEGIPFVFKEFNVLSTLHASDLDILLSSGTISKLQNRQDERTRRDEMPTGNMVIRVP